MKYSISTVQSYFTVKHYKHEQFCSDSFSLLHQNNLNKPNEARLENNNNRAPVEFIKHKNILLDSKFIYI